MKEYVINLPVPLGSTVYTFVTHAETSAFSKKKGLNPCRMPVSDVAVAHRAIQGYTV